MRPMAPETGESTAAINARSDDRSWELALPQLRDGALLKRISTKVRNYYTDDPKRPDLFRIGISPLRVKKLEAAGTLMRVGVETYALADGFECGIVGAWR